VYYRVRIRPEDSMWVVEVKRFYFSLSWKELRGSNGSSMHFDICDDAVAFIVRSGLNKTYRLYNNLFEYGDCASTHQQQVTSEVNQPQLGKEVQ
jgi:hypothetical protein